MMDEERDALLKKLQQSQPEEAGEMPGVADPDDSPFRQPPDPSQSASTMPMPGAGGLDSQTSARPPSDPMARPDDPFTAWIGQFKGKAGADPSATNDPGYWKQVIDQHGGLTPENMGYFGDRISNPNQNRGEGQMAMAPTSNLPLTDYSQSPIMAQILAELNATKQGQPSPAVRSGVIDRLQQTPTSFVRRKT